MSETPLEEQVGGNHYTKLKIQPMEYSMQNGLDACQHTAIKYITRFRDKGGVEDLRKAIHSIELLIEFEEAPERNTTSAKARALNALSAIPETCFRSWVDGQGVIRSGARP